MKKKIWVPLLIILFLLSNITTAYLVTSSHGINLKEIAKIQMLEKYIKNHYLRDVSDEQFFEGQLKGTVEALEDPYSEYFSPEEMTQFMEATKGKFFGIGVQVGPGEDNLITVISPIKGSPAEMAGIKAGDKIISVNGKEYMANEMEEAIKHIKGDKGTSVKLGILSMNDSQPGLKEVEVERDEIKMDSILYKKIEDDFGYIGITQFEESTGEDFEKALLDLEKQSIKGLILDLRGNPGGILDEAVVISDLLLPEGNIVSAKDKSGDEIFRYNSEKSQIKVPIVVLINKGSASASEIVAGALKDNKRATLVGEKSYGKGVVQTLIPIPGGAGLKLTTSEYFTPSGVNIDGKGIKPHVKVELPKDIKGIGTDYIDQDTQLQKAIEILKEGN